jgi:hypothetical protein
MLVFAAYPGVAMGLNTFFYRDFFLFGYPLAYYHRQTFWAGEFPLWNPLSFCGLPFLAQWNTMVLYPGSLLYLVLPLPWSLNLFCFIHQVIAGVGMYVLVQRWTGHRLAAGVAGLGYAFSGLTLNCLMWPNNMAGLAWMPWVIHAVREALQPQQAVRPILIAALVGLMQMLTGAPEVILFTWSLAALLALIPLRSLGDGRRRLLRLAAIVILVTGLAAAQIFPFVDLLLHSHRDAGFGVSSWAMPSTGWANFLIPMVGMFEGAPGVFAQPKQFWTSSYYVSLPLLLWAALAALQVRNRETRALGLVTLLSLVLALGENGYLYTWLYQISPVLGFIRFPIKMVILTTFCLPLLAGLGFAALASNPPKISSGATWTGLVCLLLAVAGTLWFAHASAQPWENLPLVTINGLQRAAFLLAVVGVLGLSLRADLRWRTRGLLQSAALVMIWFDVRVHLPDYNPTLQIEALIPRRVALSPQPEPGYGRAMMTPMSRRRFYDNFATNHLYDVWAKRFGLFANCNLLEGIPKVDGFYSLYLRSQYAVHASLHQLPGHVTPAAPAMDFLGARQIIAPGRLTEWEPRTSFMPLVYGGQTPVFTNDAAVLAWWPTMQFNPREVVYLPPEAKPQVQATQAAVVTISDYRFAAHEINFLTEADRPALVTVAQGYYHPWKAYVNDQRVPLLRANVGFQALEVPAGRAAVRLRYEDPAFRIGAAVSLLSLLVCGIAWRRLPGSPEDTCQPDPLRRDDAERSCG